MTKKVILDCDGVLLNWRDCYLSWLTKFGLLREDDAREYNFSKLIKLPGDEDYSFKNDKFALVLSEIFNQTFNLKKLAPEIGAVDSVRKLRSSGVQMKVVSSYTTQFEAMKSREENLNTVFGNVFQEIVSLPLHASKRDWLNNEDKESYFIEDSLKNIQDAVIVGFDPDRCFLIPQDHNYSAWYDRPDDLKDVKRLRFESAIRYITGEF